MNKRFFKGNLWIYIIMLFFISCSKKPLPKPVWNFKKHGIVLNYSADPLLNIFNGTPHTLMVIIYEMSDSSGFIKFAQYETGIRKLLNQEVKDPNILTYKRVFIEPGKSGKIVMDRVEKARWIGIVAGYYSLDPKKSVKVLKIPYKIKKKGFIKRKKIAVIPTMKVNLVFTKDSIQIQQSSEEKD